nr:uncharacterized protein LOC111422607 [Onthophagus taurus]
MDTEKLILLIQERECLWNQKNDNYHSRDDQRRSWNEVAEESKMKVEELKKKWRGLRDIFRREYKKTTTHRSGDSGEEYIPKWPFYKILFFLKDTITSRDLKCSVPDESESDLVRDCPTEDDSESNHHQPSQVRSPSPQTQMPPISRHVFKSPPKKVAKGPKHPSNFDEKLLQIEEVHPH